MRVEVEGEKRAENVEGSTAKVGQRWKSRLAEARRWSLNARNLLLVIMAAAPMQAVPAAKRTSSHVITILCLGNSLTAGFGLSRSQAYPALLTEKLRRENIDAEVINAGSSGDTTGGGLRRLPNYIRRRIDVLIIELGINDAFRGVPIETMRSNLQAIIDQTRAKWPEVQIIIAGMQVPLFANDPYVFAFGQMYPDLAAKNHAELIPFFLQSVGGDPRLNQPDRIHPNAAGQRVLAETVWNALEPLLQKIAATRATTRVN